jgi:hypothetical protein
LLESWCLTVSGCCRGCGTHLHWFVFFNTQLYPIWCELSQIAIPKWDEHLH